MSGVICKAAPSNFVEGLAQSIERKTPSPGSDLKGRLEVYVKVIEEYKQSHQATSCPDVEIRKTQNCFSLFLRCQFRQICTGWRFCERSICCTTQTVLNYSSSPEDDTIHLTAGRAQTDSRNQLTNTSFLLELYNQYGNEYLPLVYVCAIDYIEKTKMLAGALEFWKNWDPASEEPLTVARAKFFRGVMQDAYIVVCEVRREIMRKDLQENLSKLSESTAVFVTENGVGSALAPVEADKNLVVIKRTPPSMRKPSPLVRGISYEGAAAEVVNVAATRTDGESFLRMAGAAEASAARADVDVAPTRIDNSSPHKSNGGGSDEEVGKITSEIMKAPVDSPSGNSWQAFDVNVTRDDSSPVSKGVYVGDILVAFQNQKIIDDLLLMTECTQELAKEIAIKIEGILKFPCRRQDIWNEIKKEIRERDIKIKESVDVPWYEDLLRFMEENKCLKVRDLPVDTFTQLMMAKKNKIDRVNIAAVGFFRQSSRDSDSLRGSVVLQPPGRHSSKARPVVTGKADNFPASDVLMPPYQREDDIDVVTAELERMAIRGEAASKKQEIPPVAVITSV